MKPKKNLTIEDLGVKIESLATKIGELDEDIADLAKMTDNRFTTLEGKFEDFVEQTDENFGKVRKDIFSIRDTYATKKEFTALERKLELKR